MRGGDVVIDTESLGTIADGLVSLVDELQLRYPDLSQALYDLAVGSCGAGPAV